MAATVELALGRLIEAIGSEHFGALAFAVVDQAIAADHMVVQWLAGDRMRGLFTEGRLPAQVAATINQRYVERYYMLDQSLGTLQHLEGQAPVVLHRGPEDHGSPVYRQYFFERTGLYDKLAIVSRREAGLLLCNVYKLQTSGLFSGREVARARRLAPVLSASIWRHIACLDASTLPLVPALDLSAPDADNPGQPPLLGGYSQARLALRRLSRRETDVCRRVLAGASNEGAALDLGISVHTVRTLRKRIYKKLQVNSLGDLYVRYREAMSAEISSGR